MTVAFPLPDGRGSVVHPTAHGGRAATVRERLFLERGCVRRAPAAARPKLRKLKSFDRAAAGPTDTAALRAPHRIHNENCWLTRSARTAPVFLQNGCRGAGATATRAQLPHPNQSCQIAHTTSGLH